jgi:hypothetical protein
MRLTFHERPVGLELYDSDAGRPVSPQKLDEELSLTVELVWNNPKVRERLRRITVLYHDIQNVANDEFYRATAGAHGRTIVRAETSRVERLGATAGLVSLAGLICFAAWSYVSDPMNARNVAQGLTVIFILTVLIATGYGVARLWGK